MPECWPLTGSSTSTTAGEGGQGTPTAIWCPRLSRFVTGVDPSAVGPQDTGTMEYEWQFEILNHLPRDRAIDLVEHLKRMELKCSEAAGLSNQLNAEVSRLEVELDDKNALLKQKQLERGHRDDDDDDANIGSSQCWPAASSQRWPARYGGKLQAVSRQVIGGDWLMRWCWLVIAAFAVALLSDTSTFGSSNLVDTSAWRPHIVYRLEKQLEEAMRNLQVCDAKVRFNPPPSGVRREKTTDEMALVEVGNLTCPLTARGCDAEMVRHLLSENEEMKQHLGLLQGDIDDAMARGQSLVCWPVD